MALLLIDTSTQRCAVALRHGGVDTVQNKAAVRGQDALLAPMLRAALDEAGLGPGQISAIGVIIGPGAFTGVRIGVAFARALALALGISASGINALDVFALACGNASRAAGVCDIGRGELAFRLAENGVLTGGCETASHDEVRARLRCFAGADDLCVRGTGAALLGDDGFCAGGDSALDLVRTADLLQADALPLHQALPWYHRPPDARLPEGVTP